MESNNLRFHPGSNIKPSGERPHNCAVYARYSDAELQRANSIDQQVNGCKIAVAKDDGIVPDHNIFADPGYLGSDEDRPGLIRLMDVVRKGKNDFEHLYIFDTSRMARDGELAARLRKFFAFYGIILHFVSNGMVSDNAAFDVQHSIFSAFDAQFSTTLGANVKRGHRDQFQAGMVPYGRCFGYRNVDVIDPAHVESFDRRLKRKGVVHQIDEGQAEVLLLMKEMRLRDGLGYNLIARHLNERGIRSPRKPNKNPERGWGWGTIRNMLLNPRYTGLIHHGKIHTLKNPETKKLVHRKRPEEEIFTYRNESLRIFSDEEHEALKKLHGQRKDIDTSRQAGGFGRTPQSRNYLLSGLLKCDSCGHNISICQTDTYMCTNAWRAMGCTNRLKINRQSLEQHLMEVLAAKVRESATFDWLKDRLLAEIRKQDAEARAAESKVASRKHSAETDLVRINREIDTLAMAMKKHGFSEALSNHLRESEQEKALVMEIMERKIKPALKMTEEQVSEVIGDALRHLDDILRSDPINTRRELHQRISSLRLEPITFENGPAYRIKGDVRLFGGDEPMMLCSNSSSSPEHHYLTIGIDGSILKLEARGPVLRTVKPPKRILPSHEDLGALPLAA